MPTPASAPDCPGVVIADNLNNWLKWGKLVEAWALGTASLPSTLDEFRTQVKQAAVDVTIPDSFQQIAFARQDETVLTLSLPSVATIEAGRACMRNTAKQPAGYRQYPLPNFYALAFGNAPMAEFSESELLDLRTRRIGECACCSCR